GRALVDETLGYQVVKQFALAAAGGKEMLELEPSGPAGPRQAQAWSWLATRDDEHVFLLGLNRGSETLPAEIDVTALGLEGRVGIARAASASQRNEIIARPAVSGGRLSLVQAPASVVLIALDRAPGL